MVTLSICRRLNHQKGGVIVPPLVWLVLRAVLLLLYCYVQPIHARKGTATTTTATRTASAPDNVPEDKLLLSTIIAVASIRPDYAPDESATVLLANDKQDLLQHLQEQQHHELSFFPRFQSPASIQSLVDGIIHRHDSSSSRKASSSSPSSHQYSQHHRFHKHVGPNHREGYIRSTKLHGTDWVLAESKQVAVDCTTEDVLEAYLSGMLQTQWNQDKLVDCHITLKQAPPPPFEKSKTNSKDNNNKDDDIVPPPYYQQDMVLKSQRVITSHTGIMQYSQKITIDKILNNNNNNNKNAKYCVSIQMMKDDDPTTIETTIKKPFDALYVHVNLEPIIQHDAKNSVYMYAAGLLKVNRKVVPNLVVFDASGIAGSMAGKGTLWLTAYFKQRQFERQEQQQQEQGQQQTQQQPQTQQQQQHALLSRHHPATRVTSALLACHTPHSVVAGSHKNRHDGKSWLQHLLLPPWSLYESSHGQSK